VGPLEDHNKRCIIEYHNLCPTRLSVPPAEFSVSLPMKIGHDEVVLRGPPGLRRLRLLVSRGKELLVMSSEHRVYDRVDTEMAVMLGL
jgi:hypothetical protein